LKKREKSRKNKSIRGKKTRSSPLALPSAAPVDRAGVLDELDGLIGLDEVKKRLRETVRLVELGRERDRRGMRQLELSHHLVFTGNPGTGKSTVAGIVGRIYREIGLLKSGHMVEVDRDDLIAQYIGQTASKVKEVIARAMDGVLFIDEAYTLTPTGTAADHFGAEALAALLTGMDENRERLVVIAAGYKDEMDRMIDSNPGLKARFKTFIEFKDYSPDDLSRIIVHMGGEAGVRFSDDAQIAVANLMKSLEIGKRGFGNARIVRKIFQECLARQADRLSAKGSKIDVTVFEKEDIPKVGEMKFV
jgi:stage V sporulation protein K